MANVIYDSHTWYNFTFKSSILLIPYAYGLGVTSFKKKDPFVCQSVMNKWFAQKECKHIGIKVISLSFRVKLLQRKALLCADILCISGLHIDNTGLFSSP